MGKQSRRPSRRTRQSRSKFVAMTPELDEALKQQIQYFKEKFGRDPGPDDPLFFDPDEETPQMMTDEKIDKGIMETMMSVGINPAIVYAYQKTGILASEQNWDNLSSEEQAAWRNALDEWEKLGKQ
jgi:hypothetical protein